jgi:hydroxymethylglutaryl-CoA lyase
MSTASGPTIIDVSPRDGLQNEAVAFSTADKVALIRRLIDAGVTNIEATSFVHPRLVPAMADAEEVMSEVPRDAGVRYIGLVLNARGLERAIAARVDQANIVVVATDTFSRRNQNVDTKQGIDIALDLAERAWDAGIEPSVTVAAAFGCPFEGEVPTERVVDVVTQLGDQRFVRLNIADTIGVGTPRDVIDRFGRLAPLVPEGTALGTHFHNTRNMG